MSAEIRITIAKEPFYLGSEATGADVAAHEKALRNAVAEAYPGAIVSTRVEYTRESMRVDVLGATDDEAETIKAHVAHLANDLYQRPEGTS